MNKFRIFSFFVLFAMLVAACAPAATPAPAATTAATMAPAASGVSVGIVLPTKDEPRWIQDQTRFTDALTAAGFTSEILFSQGDSAKEKANVESLLTKGIKVLIITPQDAAAAGAAVDEAHAAGVKVISYDRLVTGTPNVDFYVTFDSMSVGKAQAQYLIDHNTAKGTPLYLYAGAASDNNAFLFFEGAWEALQPKIADGTFVIKNSSEAVGLQSNATLTRDQESKIIGQVTTNWDFNTAKNLAEANLTAAAAADKGTVAILAPNDGTARAIADVFAADKDVKAYTVTGQDAEKASVQYIIDGKQSMTVFKDVRTLVKDAITAAVTFLNGGTPKATSSYDNGKAKVPAAPSAVITVDKSNVQSALIDSGYYQASDFTGLTGGAAAPTAAPAATTAPAAGNVPSVPRNQTVNLGWSLTAPVGTVNPWTGVNSLSQQGNQFMFEPLAYYGIFASKSIPWLADSMDYNADFTQLTIKVNKDAAWSDGSPVTSDDVAWNFQNQMTNAKLNYNSSFVLYVKDWTITDPKTIVLNFKIPAPRFAYEVLTFKFDTGISMVPKAAYNGQSDVVAFLGGQTMLHSGPYSIVAWDANQKILDLRPDWWAVKAGRLPMPAVKRIVFQNIGGLVGQNMGTVIQRLDNNEFDAILDVRAQDIASALAANPEVKSWTNGQPPNGYLDWWPNSLWMNTQLAPFNDANVRRAMCDTIDRDKINQVLYDGAKIANIYPFPLYPNLQKFADSAGVKALEAQYGPKFNLDESAKLMTAAGFTKNADGLWADKSGKTVNATIQTLGSIHTDIAPVLVEMLKTGGFDASFNAGNDAYQNMVDGKPGLYLFGHGAGTIDPFATFFLFDSKNSAPIGSGAGNNAFSRYNNPAFDKLIDTMAPLSADDPKFQDAATQAMGIYWKDTIDCPIIQWLHRIPYNNHYWTNWPSATNVSTGENGAFWAGTGLIEITQLVPTNAQ